MQALIEVTPERPPEHGNHEQRARLQMMTCRGCRAPNFVPCDLQPLAAVSCGRCHLPILIPMQMRQFLLHTLIRNGGMGTVYQATDLMLHREVAIKLIRTDVGLDACALENFRCEAQACAALNHTNIIAIFSYEEFAGQSTLVMELADGGSLLSRVEREKSLPELDVLDVGIKIASALAAALKKNLLHRDIKPGNILFSADGEPKLVDFGLARPAVGQEEQEPVLWATPQYVAPEKVMGEPESYSSDMYSLAGTLYHALTGRAPFEASSVEEVLQAHALEPVTPPMDLIPGISQPTSDALVRAMAKSPGERYQSYDEFIMALTAARSQLLVERFGTSRSAEVNPQSDGVHTKRWWRW